MRRILMVTVVMVASSTGCAQENERRMMNDNGTLSQEALAQIGLGNLEVMSDQKSVPVRSSVLQPGVGPEKLQRDWLNNQVIRTFPEKVFRLPPPVFLFR